MFALNVEQADLLAKFERVLLWSKICTSQNLVAVTKLTGPSQAVDAVDNSYISTSCYCVKLI